METIHKLISFRRKNGYYQNDFSRYSIAAKSLSKVNDLYKAEYFLSKYYENQEKGKIAKKYIKKAVKYSEKTNILLYKNLICAIEYKFKNQNSKAIELLLEARGMACDFPILINEIDKIIATIDENSVPEKVIYDWNGIVLKFNNETEKNNFLENKTNVEIFDYQSEVISYILKYNKELNYMKNYIAKNPSKTNVALIKCMRVQTVLEKFMNFLQENFNENDYVKSMLNEIKKLSQFYSSIIKYNRCDLTAEKIIDEYNSPKCFEEIHTAIENARKNKKISIFTAKKIVFENLEKYFDVNESEINTPFLPVFYDTAFDYIQYPKEESRKLGGLFKNFSIFKKNK